MGDPIICKPTASPGSCSPIFSEAAVERGIRRFRVEVMRGNQAVAALVHDLEMNATPVALAGNVAVYELDVPGFVAGGPSESLLFRMLRLVARGLKVVVGRAMPGTA